MSRWWHASLLLALVALPRQAAAGEPKPLVLDVLILNDAAFPSVGAEQAAAILRHAKLTTADKLGFTELQFQMVGNTSVQNFLRRNAPTGNACLQEFEPIRVRPGKRRAIDVDHSAVVGFLSRWKLQALKAYFPADQRLGLGSYEAIADRLLHELDRKVELIAGFKLPSGRNLIDDESLAYRSYVRWVCAMRNQTRADVILTNAFVLYDLAAEPYPHSVFQKNKVGGASLASPARKALGGRAIFGSTFSVVTQMPFFREPGIESLSSAKRLELIGSFIVAHEIGHALFKLPDFYDHPAGCLMTTTHELGYLTGFRELGQFRGACGRCKPYVEARRLVFAAREAREERQYARAIELLRDAISATPQHIDGSYWGYVADLSVEVAELYLLSGDKSESGKWADAVLRAFPTHRRALSLSAELASNTHGKFSTGNRN